jgi:hypothetical protein
MDLIVLLLIFAFLGYFLGLSRFGRSADRTTEKVTVTSKSWSSRLADRWNAIFNPRGSAERFRRWAVVEGRGQFPEEFLAWLESLSGRELTHFVKALGDYSHGLGYSLSELVEGGLDEDPRLRQVFVEAITVYSRAYRRALEAHQRAEVQPEKEAPKAEGNDGKSPAQKAPSRRKAGNGGEVVEPASSD